MPTPEAVRAIIDAYVGALNRRDRDAFVALFADDAQQHDPIGEPPNIGHDAIAGWWERAMTEWDAFTITPREIYVIGTEAALVWTIDVRQGGRHRSFSGVDVIKCDAAQKIASVHAYWERRNLPELT